MTTNLSTNATPVDQTVDEFEAKVADFLREHQEIEMVVPVALGLLVTSRLGLRGANALLANLVIASVSRQVFQQFKKSETQTQAKEQTKESLQPSEATASPSPSETQLTEGCSIVHAVPNRIRLRIQRLAEDELYTKRLERLLQADEIVVSARVNRAAKSLVINYEGNGISEMELGLRLLGLLNRANSEDNIQNGQ